MRPPPLTGTRTGRRPSRATARTAARGTKLRWSLTADDREALLGIAEDCPGATVTYETVPFDTTK
ncbi:hypothetical protein PV721_06490 [Streptomyces sp. MB09-01]|uniref:hypothetical protein n=1 Tax=Streptomyces sp. MB09-01 TaxID=3028666 RepID=UPI0029B26496|nr:hypothetical protein [Streptomyces sp. MB09-01]MDX3534016.1 hypothetical protein [Streptomyces sp. MB09-01]